MHFVLQLFFYLQTVISIVVCMVGKVYAKMSAKANCVFNEMPNESRISGLLLFMLNRQLLVMINLNGGDLSILHL